METNFAADALAPYATATQGSIWMWPGIGVMAGFLFASFHFDQPALRGIAPAVYVIGVFVAVGFQAKRSGVQPSFGSMPKALRSNLYNFWIASLVMAGCVIALAFATNFLIAGIVIALGFTALGIRYHLRARSIVANLTAAL